MADLHKHSNPHKDVHTINERFEQKPAIPSDAAVAYNRTFDYSGFSGVTAQVTHSTNGIKMQPSGFSGSYGVLCPKANHIMSFSSATGSYLAPSKQPSYFAKIVTGDSITDHVVYAGFKVTLTDVQATDDDSVYFRYQYGVNSGNLALLISRSGTDYTYLTNVTVAVNSVYEVEIDFDENGKIFAYVNGNSVRPFPLDGLGSANVCLKPYTGVKSVSTVAPTIEVTNVQVRRVDA